MPVEITLAPGDELYRKVKAGFVLRNTTFSAWCEENGVNRSNATVALRGGWTGPKAQELVEKICKAAGVEDAS